MKKKLIILGLPVIIAAGLYSFTPFIDGNVIGKVVPPDQAIAVYAIKGADSVRTTPADGAFSFTLAPGTWKIVVDAKEPFKDAILEKVETKEGQNIDLGEIRLQQ